ncbi:MAG TPA: pitrilysin family protein [Acidobacteriota bacterium]|nr:pitrilysin family protein [Acidobacteriota bacterium]
MDKPAPIDFQEHHLDNGLKVILAPRTRIPLVHVTVHYKVGSSYESPGFSGFAHLFEHMMFQGSENVTKNEHGRLIDEVGGHWNASTNKDRTNYYATLPSHHLRLGLWLEAERMRSLKVTPESFENQRSTVIEEKKQNYDNRPYGEAFLTFDRLAYQSWAYAHPVIGDEEDLRKARVEDAQAFHRRHYGPDNAILVISGDFDPAEAMTAVEDYFGVITHQTDSRPPEIEEPAQQEAKLKVIEDPLATLPAVYMGFHMPEMGSDDFYALSMLAIILTQGNSSRLYNQFIYRRNWMTSLSGGPNNYRGPELFNLFYLIHRQVAVDEVVEAVMEELARTGEQEVSQEELEKARNLYAYRFVSGCAKVSTIGERLARYAVYFGDPARFNDDLRRYEEVTPRRMMEAAARTFRPQNSTILKILPKAGSTPS